MFLILFHFCPFLQMSYQFVLRLCQKVRLDVLINLVLIKKKSVVDDWGHFAVEDWIAVGSDDVGKWHRDSDRGAPYLLSTLQD